MTYQQLIKKLRWGWRFVEGQDISNRDLEQAATSIEELMKERDDLGRKLNTARYGQPDFAWSIHEKEMADLRAKLAIAVESIKQSIKLWEKYDDTELKWDRDYKLDNAYDGFELLFKALAELEGK